MPREEKPFGVVGCGCSGCTKEGAPLFHVGRVPFVSHSATSPTLSVRSTFLNFYRVIPSDALTVQALFAVFQGLGWKRCAFFSEPSYGAMLVDYTKGVREALGQSVVPDARLSPRDCSGPPGYDFEVSSARRRVAWLRSVCETGRMPNGTVQGPC